MEFRLNPAGISAPITHKIDGIFGSTDNQLQNGYFNLQGSGQPFSLEALGNNIAGEFLKSTVRQGANILVNREGRIQWRDVAIDAFGNAIGNSIVGAAKYSAEQEKLKSSTPMADAWAAQMRAKYLSPDAPGWNLTLAGYGDTDPLADPTYSNEPRMENGMRPLSTAERDIITDANRTINTYPVSRAFDPENPHQYYVMPWFDGTSNNRDVMDIDTNPAELQRLMRGESERVFARYYEGVGTSFGTEWFGGATGAGMTNRMNAAYNDAVGWVNRIYNNDADAQFVFGAGGFSRGATTARMFANYVEERGIPQLDSARTVYRDDGTSETVYDRYIVEPARARIGAMVLFDTVSTGFGDLYNLSIPKQAENVLHLTALDEHRGPFPLRSAIDPANPSDPRILELALPGAHSDIGGSYDRHGLADQYLSFAHTYMQRVGIPLAPVSETFRPDPTSFRIHDSSEGWWLTTDRRNTKFVTNPR